MSSAVYFTKQTIGNACGTVGLLHALGNNSQCLSFGKFYPGYTIHCCFVTTLEDGFLKTFFEKTKNMSPEERAQYLEEDEVYLSSSNTSMERAVTFDSSVG